MRLRNKKSTSRGQLVKTNSDTTNETCWPPHITTDNTDLTNHKLVQTNTINSNETSLDSDIEIQANVNCSINKDSDSENQFRESENLIFGENENVETFNSNPENSSPENDSIDSGNTTEYKIKMTNQSTSSKKKKRRHSKHVDSYIESIRNSVPLMLSPPTSNDTNSSLTSKDPLISKAKIKKSVYDLALDAAILNAENLAKQKLEESSSDSEPECKVRKRESKNKKRCKNLINLSSNKYHKKIIMNGRRFKNAVNFGEYKLAVNNCDKEFNALGKFTNKLNIKKFDNLSKLKANFSKFI